MANSGMQDQGRGRSATIEPRILDLHGAAAYCGVSYWTIREAVNGGHLPRIELPSPHRSDGGSLRRILIDRIDLDAWIDRHKERL